VADPVNQGSSHGMRASAPLLLLVTGCFAAQRPPPPPPPEPRFSLAAERQRDPEMCRRMAEWDCLGLDCPDCPSVAQSARTRDVLEVLGTLGALGLAGAARPDTTPAARPSSTPFADALHSGSEPITPSFGGLSLRAESAVESCRIVCRRCATARDSCARAASN